MIESGSLQVHYISPSILPSRSANSVHVIMQARALADSGACVTLYACRSVWRAADLPDAIHAQYGVSTSGIRLVTSFARSDRAVTVRIALMALRALLVGGQNLLISRNLYAAFLLGVIAMRPLVFEAHEVEGGVRGWMQRRILSRPNIRIVAISAKLLQILNETHGVIPRVARVLHDAAPSGITPIPPGDRRARLIRLVPAAKGDWRGLCGYFGHLYPGRGVETLEVMAEARPTVLFLIAGGRDTDVADWRARMKLPNVLFLGHLPHHQALECARCVDVLLMPYQTSVSIGVSGRDTARWMSPLKMFEYMATGVPVISSDLPVLREILRHEENALLVEPGNSDAWVAALDRLLSEAELARRIGANAHSAYLERHTWAHRARELLAL